MQDTVRDAALSFADLGYSVVPIKPRDKLPLVKWEQYQRKRADAEQINEWFDKWPEAGIAIVCGDISGHLVVIDVDDIDALSPEQEESLGGGAISETGRGGRHYFLRAPEDVKVGCSRKGMPKGVDVRGQGGYAVVPPSIHPNGNHYQWVETFDLDCTPGRLSELPAWVIEILSSSSSNGPAEASGGESADLEWDQLLAAGVPEGERHDMCLRLAGHFLGKGLGGEEVRTILSMWNARNTPPLPEKEIEQIVTDLARRELLKDAEVIDCDILTDDDRATHLQAISERFNIHFTDISRVEGDDPYYLFRISGRGVAKLQATSMESQTAWRRVIIAAAERCPYKVGGKKDKNGWDRWCNRMMGIAKKIDPGDDATMAGQVRNWLEEYLIAMPPVPNGEVVLVGDPIFMGDRTWVSTERFRKYIVRVVDIKLDQRIFIQTLSALGFSKRKSIRVRTQSNETKYAKMRPVPVSFVVPGLLMADEEGD